MRKCSGALDIYIIVGLSALLVSTNRAMREPQHVERATGWLHVFFVYVRHLNHSINSSLWQPGDKELMYYIWELVMIMKLHLLKLSRWRSKKGLPRVLEVRKTIP